jgi:hypothetical protein
MTIDPHWDKVVLALPMTGANNSTTFTDVSPSPKTITRSGDTKISTAQSMWGQGSGLFDGAGDYLSAANNNAFKLAETAFSIETWIRPATVSSIRGICSQRNNTGTSGWVFWVRDTAKLGFVYASSSAVSWVDLTGNISIAINEWTYVTVVYNGTTLFLFVNGVLDASTSSFTGTPSESTDAFHVGRDRFNNTTRDWNGYIQDLRITKGIARYTADFTPPAEPMFTNRGAISGTVYEKNQVGVYVPGAYPVRVYQRADGVLAASTTSAADGTYTIDTLPLYDAQLNPIEYYAVALDTAATWQSPGLKEQVFPT